jgi:hypothetical protein
MKRPNRGGIVCSLAAVLGTAGGTASADAPAGAAAAPEPPAPAERKFTPDKPALFISGGVSDSPFWTVGVTFPAGVTVSVGADLVYNGNGLTAPGSTTASSDKLAFSGLLYGAYYIYNKFPIGVVVEASLIEPLAPTAGSPAIAIQPGIGVYYAPFPAPIVFGSGLNLAITNPKGGSTVVSTVTPGLRIAWIF